MIFILNVTEKAPGVINFSIRCKGLASPSEDEFLKLVCAHINEAQKEFCVKHGGKPKDFDRLTDPTKNLDKNPLN